MSYDNLSSVSQNVLKFYQQLTGEERRIPFIFGRKNNNVLVMEIGWSWGVYTSLSLKTKELHSALQFQ